jgi:hypothetical protein
MKNLNNFTINKLDTKKIQSIFGGMDPVKTTSGSGTTASGVSYTTEDGYEDDNNNGKKDNIESFYHETTYSPCPNT